MGIDILKNWNNNLNAIMEEWKQLSDREKDELLEMLKQEKAERVKRIKEVVLKDLKNHVKIKENEEMMWYKWKIVTLSLPAVWDFWWYEFSYFVSDEKVRRDDFEKNPELENKSYSMREIWKMLQAFKEYMKECGVEIDWDVDYEKDLKCWQSDIDRFEVIDCLKSIGWLDDWWCWLKDKNVCWAMGSRVEWDVRDSSYGQFLIDIYYEDRPDRAYLFLRVSN